MELNTFNNNAVFVPPNPKELLNTYVIFFCKGILGTKLILLVSMGSFKFSVAGKILFFNAIIEKIVFTLPAAPSKWPIDDLVELTKILCLNNLVSH